MAQTTIKGSDNAPYIFRDTALTATVASGTTVPCELTGWNIINPNSTDVYVKFCNSAGATIGTTAVSKTLLVPANASIYMEHNKNASQKYFGTAMMVYCCTTLADSGSTAPTTALYIELFYKKS